MPEPRTTEPRGADRRFYSVVVADRRQETEDAVSLSFTIPPEVQADFGFTPGQYLTLRAIIDGAEHRRSYSICAGRDDGELRVAIKHVPGGVFSTFANTQLQPGDRIDVMPPDGSFGTAAAGRVYLGLAAGSGITPILSILKTVLAREPDSHFILLYGSRSTTGILFREQLEDLKDRNLGRLVVQHVLSREQQDVAALNGRLDTDKLRALLPGLVDPGLIDAAFICGPDTMIDGLSTTLAELGVAVGRIHSERFTSATPITPRPQPVASETPFATATVISEGRSTTIPVQEGEPVLEAAIRAGLDLPWSCRGGMCSTCRARVTEGTVAMELNFSLEPWETEQGYVLTCQAVPTSKHVVVDYDQV